jgi:hypothetical protein
LSAASPGQVGPIQAAIRAQVRQLGRLAAAEPRWQSLDNVLTEAQSQYETAGEALTTAQGYVAAASSPTVLTPPQVTRQSRITSVIRLGLLSGVVMAILGLGFFVGTGVLSRREPDTIRGQQRPSTDDRSATPVPVERNLEPEAERGVAPRRTGRRALSRAERSPLPAATGGSTAWGGPGARGDSPIRLNPTPRAQPARTGTGSDLSNRSAARREGSKPGGSALDPSMSSRLSRDEGEVARRRATAGNGGAATSPRVIRSPSRS